MASVFEKAQEKLGGAYIEPDVAHRLESDGSVSTIFDPSKETEASNMKWQLALISSMEKMIAEGGDENKKEMWGNLTPADKLQVAASMHSKFNSVPEVAAKINMARKPVSQNFDPTAATQAFSDTYPVLEEDYQRQVEGRKYREELLRKQGTTGPWETTPPIIPGGKLDLDGEEIDQFENTEPTYLMQNTEEPSIFGYIKDRVGAGVDVAKYIAENPKEVWGGMNESEKVAIATSLIPGIGDFAGPVSDARMYAEDPESITPENLKMSALGALLPFAPGMSVNNKLGIMTSKSSKEFREKHLQDLLEIERNPKVRKLFELDARVPVEDDYGNMIYERVTPTLSDSIGVNTANKETFEEYMDVRQDLYERTGLILHPSGDITKSIPNGDVKIKPVPNNKVVPFKEAIEWPTLEEQYPELAAKLEVKFDPTLSGGYFQSRGGTDEMLVVVGTKDQRAFPVASTLAHEVTHAIQRFEKMGMTGDSPDNHTARKLKKSGIEVDFDLLKRARDVMWRDLRDGNIPSSKMEEARAAYDHLDKVINSGYDKYYSNLGEVAARMEGNRLLRERSPSGSTEFNEWLKWQEEVPLDKQWWRWVMYESPNAPKVKKLRVPEEDD